MAEILKNPQLKTLLENRMSKEQAYINWGDKHANRKIINGVHDQKTAGEDHRAFARNYVNEKPVMGIPTLLAAIPAWNLAKKVGNLSGSKPSLHMMSEAYKGMGEGLLDNLLPDRQVKFDPEGDGYDYDTAKKYGIKPDETGHWASRVPQTGQLLKGKKHQTFHKTVQSEEDAGYVIDKGADGRYYSRKRLPP